MHDADLDPLPGADEISDDVMEACQQHAFPAEGHDAKSMLEIEACVTIRKEVLIIFAMQMRAQELVEILTEEEQVMPNELLKMISPSNKKAKIGN